MELKYIILTIIKILISVPTILMDNHVAMLTDNSTNVTATTQTVNNVTDRHKFHIQLGDSEKRQQQDDNETIALRHPHDRQPLVHASEQMPDPSALVVPGYNLPERIFNEGKPFYLDRDPITGSIDFDSQPALPQLYDDDYDNDWDKQLPINRRDGGSYVAGHKPSDINRLTPNFHDYLSAPTRYAAHKYTYPLISSPYANTKVQGTVNRIDNHREYSVTTYKPHYNPTFVATKSYFGHTEQKSTDGLSKRTTVIGPTVKTTTTKRTMSLFEQLFGDYDEVTVTAPSMMTKHEIYNGNRITNGHMAQEENILSGSNMAYDYDDYDSDNDTILIHVTAPNNDPPPTTKSPVSEVDFQDGVDVVTNGTTTIEPVTSLPIGDNHVTQRHKPIIVATQNLRAHLANERVEGAKPFSKEPHRVHAPPNQRDNVAVVVGQRQNGAQYKNTTGGQYRDGATGGGKYKNATDVDQYHLNATGGGKNHDGTTGGHKYKNTTGGQYRESATGGGKYKNATTDVDQYHLNATGGGKNHDGTTGGHKYNNKTGGQYRDGATGGGKYKNATTDVDQYHLNGTGGGKNHDGTTGGHKYKNTTGGQYRDGATGGGKYKNATTDVDQYHLNATGGGKNHDGTTGGHKYKNTTGGQYRDGATGGGKYKNATTDVDQYHLNATGGGKYNNKTAADRYHEYPTDVAKNPGGATGVGTDLGQYRTGTTVLRESPYDSNPFRPVYYGMQPATQANGLQSKGEEGDVYYQTYAGVGEGVVSDGNVAQVVGGLVEGAVRISETNVAVGDRIEVKTVGQVMDDALEGVNIELPKATGPKIVFPDEQRVTTYNPPHHHHHQYKIPTVQSQQILPLNSKPMFHPLPSDLTPPREHTTSLVNKYDRVRPPWDPRPGHFHQGRPEYARPPRPTAHNEIYKRIDTLPNILPQFRPNHNLYGGAAHPPHHNRPPSHGYVRQPLLERPANNRPVVGFFEKLQAPAVVPPSPPKSLQSMRRVAALEHELTVRQQHAEDRLMQLSVNGNPVQHAEALFGPFLGAPPKVVLPTNNRRNGLTDDNDDDVVVDVETLQMLQAKLSNKEETPRNNRTMNAEKPLYVVYPVNMALDNTVVIGTRAESPLPPNKINEFNFEQSNRHDSPILKPHPRPPTAQPIKSDFPYALERPTHTDTAKIDSPPNFLSNNAIDVNPPPISATLKTFTTTTTTTDRPIAVAYTPTEPPNAPPKPTNEFTVSAVMRTQHVDMATHQLEFEAPFQASANVDAAALAHGWAVIGRGKDDGTTQVAPPLPVTTREFDIENFRPQLEGGFKPIYSYGEEGGRVSGRQEK